MKFTLGISVVNTDRSRVDRWAARAGADIDLYRTRKENNPDGQDQVTVKKRPPTFASGLSPCQKEMW